MLQCSGVVGTSNTYHDHQVCTQDAAVIGDATIGITPSRWSRAARLVSLCFHPTVCCLPALYPSTIDCSTTEAGGGRGRGRRRVNRRDLGITKRRRAHKQRLFCSCARPGPCQRRRGDRSLCQQAGAATFWLSAGVLHGNRAVTERGDRDVWAAWVNGAFPTFLSSICCQPRYVRRWDSCLAASLANRPAGDVGEERRDVSRDMVDQGVTHRAEQSRGERGGRRA